MIDSYKGTRPDRLVLTLHKVYTAEGGQVYIYSTVDGHALDNSQVTVVGTVTTWPIWTRPALPTTPPIDVLAMLPIGTTRANLAVAPCTHALAPAAHRNS